MNEKREKLLIKIAYLYYIEGKKQSEISRELNVNQGTISRMLLEARKKKSSIYPCIFKD